MSWYVYMLRCSDGSLYTGCTDDIERRFSCHNSGKGAKYTRGRGPLELVYTIDDLNKFAYIGENNPWFGVTLDFAHFASLGIIKPDLSQLKLPVFNIHLSQLTEEKMHAPLTAQNGKVDVPGVCKLLRDYGYTGRIILELSADYAESLQLFREISRNI